MKKPSELKFKVVRVLKSMDLKDCDYLLKSIYFYYPIAKKVLVLLANFIGFYFFIGVKK